MARGPLQQWAMSWLRLTFLTTIVLIATILLYLLSVRTRWNTDTTRSSIVAVWNDTAAPSACERGFDAFRHRNQSLHSVFCVSLSPPTQHHLGGRDSLPSITFHGLAGDKYYRKDFEKFFADVAHHITLSGSLFVIIEDDATLPSPLTSELRRLRTPLLAHAMRKPDSDTEPLDTQVVLIPDFHFIRTEGFAETIRRVGRVAAAKPYALRSPVVFWRGSTTSFNDKASPCLGLPRVQLCVQALRDCPQWCDFQLNKIVQRCNASHHASLERLGVWSHSGSHTKVSHSQSQSGSRYEPEERWAYRRGLLDIDGNVNAWGLLWRLRSGSVVFRVESDYASIYSERLRPFEHYVPIRKDLSDLCQVTRLVASRNVTEVEMMQRIAERAAALAAEYTYEGTVIDTAQALTAIWNVSTSLSNS